MRGLADWREDRERVRMVPGWRLAPLPRLHAQRISRHIGEPLKTTPTPNTKAMKFIISANYLNRSSVNRWLVRREDQTPQARRRRLHLPALNK